MSATAQPEDEEEVPLRDRTRPDEAKLRYEADWRPPHAAFAPDRTLDHAAAAPGESATETPWWSGRVGWVQAALLLVVWGWVLLILAAPYLIPAGSAPDLTGTVGRYDNAEVIEAMNPVARFVYWMGDVNCHQKVWRSFVYNGNETPFCARDIGIFVGIAVGYSLGLWRRLGISLPLVALALVPIAVDGGVQLFSESGSRFVPHYTYESTNFRRVVTGLLAGGVTGLALAFIAGELSNARLLQFPPHASQLQWEREAALARAHAQAQAFRERAAGSDGAGVSDAPEGPEGDSEGVSDGAESAGSAGPPDGPEGAETEGAEAEAPEEAEGDR